MLHFIIARHTKNRSIIRGHNYEHFKIVIVELYISGDLIETEYVDLSGCKTIEWRQEKVEGVIKWLVYKYRMTIMIKSNWFVILKERSKMNGYYEI